MNPLKVFGVLAALLAAIAAFALSSRTPEPTSTPAQASTPIVDPSLTDAEAIARFKELKELRDRAYRTRDLALIPRVFTSDSPAMSDVTAEIVQLKADNVLDRTVFRTLSVKVLHSDPDEIVLLQEVVVLPKVTSESGKDVTTGGRAEMRRVRWTLQPQDDEWFVFRTLVVDAKPRS